MVHVSFTDSSYYYVYDVKLEDLALYFKDIDSTYTLDETHEYVSIFYEKHSLRQLFLIYDKTTNWFIVEQIVYGGKT